jgi:predicted CXXCH cytochrome family protein
VRTRTTKKLARRIDLNYFKTPSGLRRTRFLFAVALPIAGLLWLAGMATAGSRAPYSSGPVSTTHAFIENKCEKCHTPEKGAFRDHTPDNACLACHPGPQHFDKQSADPAAPREFRQQSCRTCHRDHEGRVRLAAMDNRFCLDCHSDLKVPGGQPKILTKVTHFPGDDTDHPEFAAVDPTRKPPPDPGTIKFNHEVHMREREDGLRTLTGTEKMKCETCHTPGVTPASKQRPATVGLMTPIGRSMNCERCHSLFFDSRVDVQIRHADLVAAFQDDPRSIAPKVHAFVQQSLADYIKAHPDALTAPEPPSRLMPLSFPRPFEYPSARTPQEWVDRRTQLAEKYLWTAACSYCHKVDGVDVFKPETLAASPRVAAVQIKTQWMPNAKFDHLPHRMAKCEMCHDARQSKLTADVLMPKKAVCATCHSPSKGAESRCFECHAYHDQRLVREHTGKYELKDFQ